MYYIGVDLGTSAVKLLPPGLGRNCAALSLAVCLVVYMFNGWVALYPPLLGVVGFALEKKRRKKTLQSSAGFASRHG